MLKKRCPCDKFRGICRFCKIDKIVEVVRKREVKQGKRYDANMLILFFAMALEKDAK